MEHGNIESKTLDNSLIVKNQNNYEFISVLKELKGNTVLAIIC